MLHAPLYSSVKDRSVSENHWFLFLRIQNKLVSKLQRSVPLSTISNKPAWVWEGWPEPGGQLTFRRFGGEFLTFVIIHQVVLVGAVRRSESDEEWKSSWVTEFKSIPVSTCESGLYEQRVFPLYSQYECQKYFYELIMRGKEYFALWFIPLKSSSWISIFNLLFSSFFHSFKLFSARRPLTSPLYLFQGTSDFCVSPDKFLLSQTKGVIGSGEFQRESCCVNGVVREAVTLTALQGEEKLTDDVFVFFTDIVHYYLYCNQTVSNPFQQVGNRKLLLNVGRWGRVRVRVTGS